MEKLFNIIRRSAFFNHILRVLGIFGIDRWCIRIMYKWFEQHPTEEMRKTTTYFKNHRDDIVRIQRYLADDKSREIWKKMIRFRMTMDYRYHPDEEKDQYFVDGIMQLGEKEVFIDCGGYDGQTTLDFIEKCQGRYQKIVIFEPDDKCLPMIHKKLKNDKRIKVISKGVWDTETHLSFVSSGDSASHVVEAGGASQKTDVISVVSIDRCDECRDATFIKMDLEGAEQRALKGAEQTIKRNTPKLAICIYHSDEDMIKIIDYLHNLVPEYKLYVRHHSTAAIETVVYAVK